MKHTLYVMLYDREKVKVRKKRKNGLSPRQHCVQKKNDFIN